MAEIIYECVCGGMYGITREYTPDGLDRKERGVYHEQCYLHFIWDNAQHLTDENVEELAEDKARVDRAIDTHATLDKLL